MSQSSETHDRNNEVGNWRPSNNGWWGSARSLFRIIMLVRFSVIMALIVAVSGFLGQGQEALLALAGSQGDFSRLSDKMGFVGALLMAAFSVWYSARVMYCFRFDDPVSESAYLPGFKRWLPRLLAALMLLSVAAVLLQAARISSQSMQLYLLAGLLVLIAALFLMRLPRAHAWLGIPLLHDCIGSMGSLRELPRNSRLLIIGWYLLGLGTLLVFSLQHSAELATWMGPLPLVYVAVAMIVPVGSWLVYVGNRHNVPMVSIILLVVLLASYFNDNHHVRQTADMDSIDPFLDQQQLTEWEQERGIADPLATYNSLDDYIGRWLQGLQAIHGEQPIPVVIVSAEGGGIRAAYWSALVLSELHDSAEFDGLDLPRHLLAISGVSGGSLGGAAYAALVAGDHRAGEQGAGDPLRARAGAFLSRDFLSPVLSSLLFPDLLQRFIPWPLFDDRAMALEQSWERGWREVEGNELFAQSLDSLYSGSNFQVPLLFFNTTVVETGQQMIVHPLDLYERAASEAEMARSDPCIRGARLEPFPCTFADALDSVKVVGDQIPLSTAVHLSARFTYLSPAGTIHRVDLQGQDGVTAEQAWIRVVDGGYFENSGEVTAGQILLALRRVAWNKAQPFNVRPIVVHLSNDPLVDLAEKMADNPGKRVLAGELLSPLRAIFNTREARGLQARNEVQNRIVLTNSIGSSMGDVAQSDGEPESELDDFFQRQRGLFLHFRPCEYDVPLPLGWMLSDMARDELERQMPAEDEQPQRFADWYNRGLADRLVEALKTGETEVAGVVEMRSYAQCLQAVPEQAAASLPIEAMQAPQDRYSK